jgi:hypothetical protein
MNGKLVAVYHILCKTADIISPNDLAEMLEHVEYIVNSIKATDFYKDVLDTIRSNKHPIPPSILKGLLEITEEYPHFDGPTILWLLGLQVAANNTENADTYAQTQLVLFLACQSCDFYRIADDKMRLLVTYTYLRTITHVLLDK